MKLDRRWAETGWEMDKRWSEDGQTRDGRWTRDRRKMDGRWVEVGCKMDKRWKKDGWKMGRSCMGEEQEMEEDGWSVRLHVTTCTLHVPGKSRRLLFVAAVIIT